jgi:hypothetical protein
MKKVLSIIALALIIIAGNLTYTNFSQEKSVSPNEIAKKVFAQEQVVKVVGKSFLQFDGLESEMGFLVETANNGFHTIPIDEGSMASVMDSPPYLKVYWPKDMDRPMVDPIAIR